MSTRIAVGRAAVVREVRAAAPLMADLRAPVTARGPWLTAVLNAGAARRGAGRPVAVVVGPSQGRPDAVAFLTLRRRGPARSSRCSATAPGRCRPAARRSGCSPGTREAAELLAAGVCDLLGSLRGPATAAAGRPAAG